MALYVQWCWSCVAVFSAVYGAAHQLDSLFVNEDRNGSGLAAGSNADIMSASQLDNGTTDFASNTGSATGVVSIPGDFVLGGLFPVHKRSVTSAPCGDIQAQRGIQVGSRGSCGCRCSCLS